MKGISVNCEARLSGLIFVQLEPPEEWGGVIWRNNAWFFPPKFDKNYKFADQGVQ